MSLVSLVDVLEVIKLPFWFIYQKGCRLRGHEDQKGTSNATRLLKRVLAAQPSKSALGYKTTMLALSHHTISAPATLDAEEELDAVGQMESTILSDEVAWYRAVDNWDFNSLTLGNEVGSMSITAEASLVDTPGEVQAGDDHRAYEPTSPQEAEADADGIGSTDSERSEVPPPTYTTPEAGPVDSPMQGEFGLDTALPDITLDGEPWSVLNTLERNAELPETPRASFEQQIKMKESNPIKLVALTLEKLEAQVQAMAKQSTPIGKTTRVCFVLKCGDLLPALEGHLQTRDGTMNVLDLLQRMNSVLFQYRDLVDPFRSCMICSEAVRVSRFPMRVTANCEHIVNNCLSCLANWIATQVAAWGPIKLQCMECAQSLDSNDIKTIASLETFQKYMELQARKVFNNMDEFQWCLNPKCESGQLHYGGARLECHACNNQACIKHGVAWHNEETCEQYDERRKSAKDEDEASEEWKVKTTRACPFCDAPIEKNGGCSHMNCWKCDAHFSWEDSAVYDAKAFVWERDLSKTFFQDKRKRTIPWRLWARMFPTRKSNIQYLKGSQYVEDGC